MDETPPILNRSTNQSSLFEGINKYLFFVLGLLILIIIVIVLYIVFVKKSPLPTSRIPTETIKNPSQPNSQQNTSVTSSPEELISLTESRFNGTVTNIDQSHGNTTVYTLQSVINSPDKTALFTFTPDQIKKAGSENFLANIKVGDRINSIQWISPALAENDGLVAFVFTKPETITTPYNIYGFDIIKLQKTPGISNILERIYTGKIEKINIDGQNSTVALTLQRQMYDGVSTEDTFVYQKDIVDRTITSIGNLKGLSVYQSLKIGDKIDMSEQNDYTKEYNQSVQSITVSKL